MSQTETTNNLHEKVCEPLERHIYSKINQNTTVKDKNTVIEPGVDYKKDIEDIKQGKAKYDAQNRQFEVNGRTYEIHNKPRQNGDYRSFPIGGKGTHQLNRGEFKAFQEYKTHSNNPQLLETIISNQKKSYVKSSSQKRDAAERFEKDLKRGRDVWEICQAKEKAINQANKFAQEGHTKLQITKKLKREGFCKKNPQAAVEIARKAYEDHKAHKANKNKNNTQLQEVKGENKGQNHNSKNEVGNKVKGNNSNSLNSSSSSSQTNDYSATQVNGKKQTSTNSEQNIPNKGGQKVQNTSKPTTSAKSSTKTPPKPKNPPGIGPSH